MNRIFSLRKYLKNNIKDIKLSFTDKYIILVLSFIILICLKTDIDFMKKSGTVDLRNRVVGARSHKAGFEPYFFKWSLGMSARLYDPVDFTNLSHRSVSRLSVTPTALLLHLPLTDFDFLEIQTVWFFIQYLLFISSALLLIFGFKLTDNKKLLVLFLCILFLISYSWRLHVERGQIYILYTFLNILFFVLLSRSNSKSVLLICGFILSFLISLRPTFLIYLVPLMIFKKHSLVKPTLLTGLILFFLTSVILGSNIWPQYNRAMSMNDRFFNSEPSKTNTGLMGNIEGVRYISGVTGIPSDDSSVNNTITKYFGFETNIESFKIISLIFISLTAFCLFMISRKIKTISLAKILIISGILQIVVDILIPAPRYSYVDILILPIFALIIFDSRDIKDFMLNRCGWIPFFGIITFTSLMNTESFISIDFSIEIGQILIYLYLFIYMGSLLYRLYFFKQIDT